MGIASTKLNYAINFTTESFASVIPNNGDANRNLQHILDRLSNGLGDNEILWRAHHVRISFKKKFIKNLIETKDAANSIAHFMEYKNNHNKQYDEDHVVLLNRFKGNIPSMSLTNDDHCMILIAHRVRSIIISKSLSTSHKKYKIAANKIIHYMDHKNFSTSHNIIPDDFKMKLLQLFENDAIYSYCNV